LYILCDEGKVEGEIDESLKMPGNRR